MPASRLALVLAVTASWLACASAKQGTFKDSGPPEDDLPDGSPTGTHDLRSPMPSPDGPLASTDVLMPGVDLANGAAGDTSPGLAPDAPCGSPTDPRNCGTCGHDCTKLPNVAAAMVTCQAGKCVVPAGACASGWAHCSASPDDGCEADLSRAQTCGACGTTCGTGKMCALSGQSYQCVSCGATGQACCGGTTCSTGNSCSNGVCTANCVAGAACGTNNQCTKSLISCTTGTPVCVSMAINEGLSCGTATCSGSSAVEKRCSGGQCVSQTPKSCMYGCSGGTCNADCPSGFNKTATGCTPCGGGTEFDPQPCCLKGTPCSGKRICCTGSCGGNGEVCIPCGIVLHPCCGPQRTDSSTGFGPFGTCDSGLVCTDQGRYQQPPTTIGGYLCDPPP